MVKKLTTLAENEETQLADAVRISAQQIWQAGLGAFAKAQEEGGRVFDKLVKEGTDLQKRTRDMAEERVAENQAAEDKGTEDATATETSDGASKRASGPWDKLEQVFEDRVARALSTIGVPTHKDLQALTLRVEELSQLVAQLGGKPTQAEKPATRVGKSVATPVVKGSAKPGTKTVAKPVAKPAEGQPAAKKTSAKAATKDAELKIPQSAPKKAAAKKAAPAK